MKAQYITPSITFFDDKGNLNRMANEKLFDHLIAGGMDGIAVMGSSGEFFSMSNAQRRQLTEMACSHIAGRVKTLIGIGCMTAEESVGLGKHALENGADGIMLVGPYYINLSPESIEHYFSTVIDQLDGPVYLYNYPDRTGYDLDIEITLRLLRRHPNIAGYKDTLPHMSHTRELIKATVMGDFPNFEVFCGYDDNFAHNVLDGGAGAISALSNLVPDICSGWVKAFRENDLVSVAETQRYIDRLMDLYFITAPFMPLVKRALQLRGMDVSTHSIGPLIPPTAAQEQALTKLMDDLQIKSLH